MAVPANDPGRGAFLFCSIEESIHRRLRQNDEQFTDLQLWLNSNSCVRDLTEALAKNTCVEEVCLLIHESFGATTAKRDILELFAVLGRLPNLTKLFFNTYRFPFVATLPVEAFTNIFRGPGIGASSTNRSSNLVEFKLWRTDLYGCGQGDIEAWALALAHNCPNLQEFRLIKCRLTEENEEEAIRDDVGTFGTLDPMLRALATLPRLKEVELSASKLSALGSLSPSSLQHLLATSQSLQSFSLMHFDLSENAVLAIAQALLHQHNQLPAHTRSHHDNHKRIPQSQTTTERSDTHQQAIVATQSVANAHQQYSKASNLKHVKLSGVGSTASMFRKPLRDAFRNVLQCNYLLETLFLFDERNLQQDIRFYLKLNRMGRNRLLQRHQQDPPPSYDDDDDDAIASASIRPHDDEWIDILVQVRDDLDCLFYFLHECPLLLC